MEMFWIPMDVRLARAILPTTDSRKNRILLNLAVYNKVSMSMDIVLFLHKIQEYVSSKRVPKGHNLHS